MIVRNAASAATMLFCLLSAPSFAQQVPPVAPQADAGPPPGPPEVTAEPGAAQTATAEANALRPGSGANAGDALGDIVVTAQRREEKLQDVPVAVTALSRDFISQNQVRTLQDLGASVPGLVVTNSVNYGSAPLSIRGVGGANGGGNVLADEPVAVYVDDAFVSRLRLSTADLIDVGDIEVLRGPQGTLYGRNSTAGAVLIRSAEPTRNLSARLSGSVATLDEYRIQGAISGPLTKDGSVLARIAGGYSDVGGWGSNDAGGPKLNRGRNWQIRGFLRFKPTDRITFDLIGDASYQKSFPGTLAVSDISNLRDQNSNPAGSNVVYPYVPRKGLGQLLADDRFALNYPTYTRIIGQNVTGRLNWDLGSLSLVSITNYRRWRLQGSQDSDGTLVDPPTPIFVTGDISNVGDNDGRFRDTQFSQEVRLASSGTGRFSYTLGAFYFNEHNAVDPIRIRNRLAGPGGAGTQVTFTAFQTTDAYALFANLGYNLTEALKLSVGGRYSHERKNIVDTQLVTTINQFDPPGPAFFGAGQVLVPLSTLTQTRTDHNFSPRVVLDYKVTPRTLVYASFSQGFKSGGFNAFRGVNFAFEPERIDAYEVGLKTDIGRILRLNASAYHYDYRNLQVRTPVATGGVGIESAQRARVQGFELEASLLPAKGLRFDANLAYLDAKFRAGTLTAIQQPSFVLGANPAVVQEDIAGNSLTRAPRFQGAISGRYAIDTGLGSLAFQASVRHQSSVYFLETQQQQSTFRGDGWAEIDARISLAGAADKWEVAVFGKNLNDNRHLSQVTAFFGLPNASVNEPRKVGIQFAVKY